MTDDYEGLQPPEPVQPEKDVFFQFASETERNKAIDALRKENFGTVEPRSSLRVVGGASKKQAVTDVVEKVAPSAERMRHDT
jgi:hypothetical protein